MNIATFNGSLTGLINTALVTQNGDNPVTPLHIIAILELQKLSLIRHMEEQAKQVPTIVAAKAIPGAKG